MEQIPEQGVHQFKRVDMCKKNALLIGNGRFIDDRFQPLNKTTSDNAELSKVLHDPEIGHFDKVTTVIDQNFPEVRRQIGRFFAEAKHDDLLLLYFSGHGEKDLRGDLHLIASDTDKDCLHMTGLSAAAISKEMDDCFCHRIILILDCCYSGAFAHGAKGGCAGTAEEVSTAFRGKGRMIMTAASPAQQAWENGPGECSVFTHCLVEGLASGEADANGDGQITFDELYDYVYANVIASSQENSRQTPQKWCYGQQGKVVIARSRRVAKKTRPGLRGDKSIISQPLQVNNEMRPLKESLEQAYLHKEKLATTGGDFAEVDRQIIDLRSRIREGKQLKAGDSLLTERFHLIEKAGQGGFATVWKAYDRETNGLVAVKILHGQLVHDRSHRERFFRGARKMAEVCHRGIVRIVEKQLEEDGVFYFVMEYVDGTDLQRAVLERRLQPKDRIRIILDAGEALHFAHQRGIVHRDVKPSNILLDHDGRTKLTDFDLVRAVDTTGGTRTGMLGTVIYAAPELMEHASEAGIPADVYGLGMAAIFLVAGSELPLDIMRNPKSFLEGLDAPMGLKAVLARSVAWDLLVRYESVKDFCTELEPFYAESERSHGSSQRQSRTSADGEVIPDPVLGREDSQERQRLIAAIPERLGAGSDAVEKLAAVRQQTSHGAELYFVREALERILKETREGHVTRLAQEEIEQLFSHLATPPILAKTLVDLPVDERVPYWCIVEGKEQRFRIGRIPVTNILYERFDPRHRAERAFTDLLSHEKLDNHPVVNITWYEAEMFCRWLTLKNPGTRLPTEADWEFAATSRKAIRYPWGSKQPTMERAHFGLDRETGSTARVGILPAGGGPFDTLDQSGNVWEWCHDLLSDEPEVRALRGGSWSSPARHLVSTARNGHEACYRLDTIGFRCMTPVTGKPVAKKRNWFWRRRK